MLRIGRSQWRRAAVVAALHCTLVSCSAVVGADLREDESAVQQARLRLWEDEHADPSRSVGSDADAVKQAIERLKYDRASEGGGDRGNHGHR